jgi:hypothetical protein
MFSSLLESAKVRLFQATATDAYSRLERTRAVYKCFRRSKVEKLYVMKQISLNSFSAREYNSQYDDENAAYYPA